MGFIPGPLIKSSAYPVQLPTCQQSHARTITHLPTISCPHHHLPRPLIKSSAYPVQLPTCQQSHAPTTTSRGHSSNHQHIQYNYPPANNLMPPPPPPEATHQIISISSTITHLPTISCPYNYPPANNLMPPPPPP